MSCAFTDCGDPLCEVCSVPRRFAHIPTSQPKSVAEAEGVHEDARAVNGTRPARTNRDPIWVPRKRKALR
jgi:hypothetical protein